MTELQSLRDKIALEILKSLVLANHGGWSQEDRINTAFQYADKFIEKSKQSH